MGKSPHENVIVEFHNPIGFSSESQWWMGLSRDVSWDIAQSAATSAFIRGPFLVSRGSHETPMKLPWQRRLVKFVKTIYIYSRTGNMHVVQNNAGHIREFWDPLLLLPLILINHDTSHEKYQIPLMRLMTDENFMKVPWESRGIFMRISWDIRLIRWVSWDKHVILVRFSWVSLMRREISWHNSIRLSQ